MNKIFLAVLFLFATSAIYSQNFTARVLAINSYVYLGIDNAISCTIENTSTKKIVLTTDNGSITKEGDVFIYRGTKGGVTPIAINIKKGNTLKKVGDFYVEVRPLPKQIAQVGGIRNDSITKGALKAQQGVGCSWLIPGFEISCTIDSFSVTIFRNGDVIRTLHSVKNIFNKDVRDLFELIQVNDHVLFSGITSYGGDKVSKPIDPIELIIK
ncbi:MAG: hypothetical protein ABI480_14835 [Chitinophagaceae bacterium]